MEIRKFLTGEVMSVGNNGKITKVAEGLKGVNHNSVISWELPVKAGSKTEISYTYKVYISH
jgi:ribosomal protein S1